MDREAWLKERAPNVNSTESPALFGMSPWSSEFKLYHDKLAGGIDEIPENWRMTVGKVIESAIAELFTEKTGVEVVPFKEYLQDSEARIGSSFDFKTADNEAIVEIKNVDSLQFKRLWTESSKGVIEEAPAHIEAQVQHQMEVADMDTCYICAFVGGNELSICKRARDRVVGQVIRQKVAAFWQRVDARDEPDPNMPMDASFLIQLYSTAGGNIIEATAEMQGLMIEYVEAQKAFKAAEEVKKVIKANLLHLVGDADGVIGEDGYKLSCKQTRDTPPTEIEVTADMVGETITYGGRKGFRGFRINQSKKEAKSNG